MTVSLRQTVPSATMLIPASARSALTVSGDCSRPMKNASVHAAAAKRPQPPRIAGTMRPLSLLAAQLDGLGRNYRRYRVLINKLLPAVGIEHDREAVVGADNAVHLKSVYEKHRETYLLAAKLIEECVLKILCLFASFVLLFM